MNSVCVVINEDMVSVCICGVYEDKRSALSNTLEGYIMGGCDVGDTIFEQEEWLKGRGYSFCEHLIIKRTEEV